MVAGVFGNPMCNNSKYNILFRCDGGHKLGLGHLYRCQALALELQNNYTTKISFAIIKNNIASKTVIEDCGFNTLYKSEDSSEEQWILNIVKQKNISCIIFDIRTKLNANFLRTLRLSGIKIVLIDDASERYLQADLLFLPPTPDGKKLPMHNAVGKKFCGWEWVLLRKQFNHLEKPIDQNYILIVMGGSDPKHFTLKTVEAINKIETILNIKIITGCEFQDNQQLQKILATTKHQYHQIANTKNMAKLMLKAKFAICTFGMIAYELASTKTPALYFCLHDDHRKHAALFVKNMFGEYAETQQLKFVEQIYKKWKTLQNKPLITNNIAKGCQNIARVISKHLISPYSS